MKPDIQNIHATQGWFEVLQTTKRNQTAVMILAPGKSSGDTAEAHEDSEQTLLLVEGELSAEIEGEKTTMKAGDVVVIAPGKKHRFTNQGSMKAVTFNVYCPPEYAPDEKE